MVLIIYIILICVVNVFCDMCPKQCDCDMSDELNRAICVDQNIIDIDVGVPKAVQVYILKHNVISELDNFCFKQSGYTSLQLLDISYNLIFWIGLHAFSELNDLVNLNLSNNRLRYIPSDLFWDTPKLDTLDLSSNVFEKLKNEPFIMHTKLQVLNLNNCRIKSLPDRMFNRLPNLKKLDLSENYMVTLSTEVLGPMRKLERIELYNDYWQCNPEFTAVETWIVTHGIAYQRQCMKMSQMSGKMISIVNEEREEVNVDKVWNITKIQTDNSSEEPNKPLTPLDKFDKDFSALQSFIIGLEIGLAIGIVGTYIWLRKLCKCTRLHCTQPETRRRRHRVHRTDGDMRSNLLWSTVIQPDETPPSFRRQLSLPDRNPTFNVYGVPTNASGSALHVDAIRLPDRSETPPPPYNECRINMST